MTTPQRILSLEEAWQAYDDIEARLTAPLSERMFDLAALRPGLRVLDLATGRGEPAIRAARRVGPTGRVLGVDPSESMLQMTRARATREGVSNLDLRAASAESLDGIESATFDVALARWGLMYMSNPVAALAEARRALVPGGVLVAAVWVEPERVSYYSFPRRVLEKHRALPPIDFEAPGTFHYADPDRLPRDLAAAGLGIVHAEDFEVEVMEAATDAELVAWTRAFGLTRLLNELPEETQLAWEMDLVREAAPLWREGVVRLGGVTRLVVAKAGERRTP